MQHRVRWALGIATAVALSWAMTSPCYADLIFTLGNNPQPSEENILFGAKETGNPISGATNQTHTSVTFSTTASYLLDQKSQGQADVSGISGGNAVDLTNITITPGVSVKDMILNPSNATRDTTATVTVKGTDSNGNPETGTFSYTIGNGNNFLTIEATNGESITSVTVDTGTTGSFKDLKQPRISGAAAPQIVPEPTTLALAGMGTIGLVGLGWRRRYRAA